MKKKNCNSCTILTDIIVFQLKVSSDVSELCTLVIIFAHPDKAPPNSRAAADHQHASPIAVRLVGGRKQNVIHVQKPLGSTVSVDFYLFPLFK